MIHHYTSPETLGLILDSRRLRFNRTDRVDDALEAERHPFIRFGRYFYVSCWTRDGDESIPLWQMYSGGMTGVRISLPDYPFQRKALGVPPGWQVEQEGRLYAPLTFDEVFGDDYLILPTYMKPETFGGAVEYRDDVEARYRDAISLVVREGGKAELKMKAPFDLVRLKTREWEFQREYRFSLIALPSIPVPPEGPGSPEFFGELPNHMLNAFVRGIGPAAEFLDVDLSNEAFQNMTVTLGPLSSGETKAEVHALIDRYAPNARIEESRLTGKIRAR